MPKDPNVYVKTYFRIESGYVWGVGHTKEQKERFNSEVTAIMTKLGFTIKEPKFAGGCYEAFRGAENLYLHPQGLTGYVKRESIQEINNALMAANGFKHYRTDTYDEVMNYTEEELLEALKNKQSEIEEMILETFTTARKNLFKSGSSLQYIDSGIKYFDDYKLQNIEKGFIRDVFNQLIEQGKIETAKTRIGEAYRTTVKKKKVNKVKDVLSV